MANLGTERLKIVNDQPSVTKLWNDRYRLEFYLDNDGKKEDWYAGNIGNILPAFGTLQADQFGIGNWLPREDEAYDNMRCISANTEYVPAANKHYVKLVYETLSDAFVAEEDDTTEYSANGLKRITRPLIAESGVTYDKVVGATIEDGLCLASYKIEDTDAYRRVEEVWMEEGILSFSINHESSQEAVVVEAFNAIPRLTNELIEENGVFVPDYSKPPIPTLDPEAPLYKDAEDDTDYYTVVKKDKSEFEGIPTIRYTFLKPSVLSFSTTHELSQKQVVVEAFKKVPYLTNQLDANGDPIYNRPAVPTFDVAALPYKDDENDFSFYVVAKEEDSNFDGIPTKRYTFMKPSILSFSINDESSQKAVVVETFDAVPYLTNETGASSNPVYSAPPVPTLDAAAPAYKTWEEDIYPYAIAKKDESNFEGIPTVRYTFLKPSILSFSVNRESSQKEVIVEAFNTIPYLTNGEDGNGGTDYSEPVPTIDALAPEYVDSEDDITPYVIARKDKSNFEGINTLRYTFVKPGIISTKEDNGPQGLPNTKTRQYVSLITEPVNPEGESGIYEGILLSKSVDNSRGYPMYTYTYLEGNTAGSSPTGEGTLLQTYNKYIEVRKAGEISATTVSAPSGATGATAVLSVVPPSIKKVSATISVDLFTSATPPTLDATPAFDLSEVSASASITTTRRSPVGVEQGVNLSVSVFNVRVNSETRSYPNHFFTAPASVSSTITSPSHIVRDDDNIIGESLDETTSTNINFTGSDTAPLETGIYQQDIEPVFVDADGNQYYRKTTYTV